MALYLVGPLIWVLVQEQLSHNHHLHRCAHRIVARAARRMEHPSAQAGGPWVTVARGNLKRVPAGQEKGVIGIQGIGIRTEGLGTLLKERRLVRMTSRTTTGRRGPPHLRPRPWHDGRGETREVHHKLTE